jgi:hypothetical protein
VVLTGSRKQTHTLSLCWHYAWNLNTVIKKSVHVTNYDEWPQNVYIVEQNISWEKKQPLENGKDELHIAVQCHDSI